MLQFKKMNRLLCLMLSSALVFLLFLNVSGCAGEETQLIPTSENLMAGVQRGESAAAYDFTQEVQAPESYEKYVQTLTDFSASLIQGAEQGKNTLLSPVSTYLLLAMAANGTDGDSLKECRKVLGDGVVSLNNINACSDYLLQRLCAFNSDTASLSLANSMWVREGIDIKRTFLQKNANYYNAGAFSEDFSDAQTLNKINGWTKEQTNGAISSVLDSIDPQTTLSLVSALSLDAPWVTAYTQNDIQEGTFAAGSGNKTIQFMRSSERYIQTDNATGFIKNLDTLPLRFIAILPNEDLSLEEYLTTLTGEELSHLAASASATEFTQAYLPAFSCSYTQDLAPLMEDIGLSSLFSKDADFSKMTSESVWIHNLTHKTSINIGPQGIQAGLAAVTGAAPDEDFPTENSVVLNRPFLYMLVDNESNIPVLIGTVFEP